MAERRMFSKTIVDSDAFLGMPLSSQALYFHLAMRADDDGFINNPKMIMRMTGANEDDLTVLLGRHFLISFDSGVLVIKHWKQMNYLQKDRYRPTIYTDEKAQLMQLPSKEYALYTECIQNGYIGKDSIDKNSIVKNSIVKNSIDKDNEGSWVNLLRNERGEYVQADN